MILGFKEIINFLKNTSWWEIRCFILEQSLKKEFSKVSYEISQKNFIKAKILLQEIESKYQNYISEYIRYKYCIDFLEDIAEDDLPLPLDNSFYSLKN